MCTDLHTQVQVPVKQTVMQPATGQTNRYSKSVLSLHCVPQRYCSACVVCYKCSAPDAHAMYETWVRGAFFCVCTEHHMSVAVKVCSTTAKYLPILRRLFGS